jgi:hypothetical protein
LATLEDEVFPRKIRIGLTKLYNFGKATLRVVGYFSSAAVVTIFDDPLAPLNTKMPPCGDASFSGLGGPGRSTFRYRAGVP